VKDVSSAETEIIRKRTQQITNNLVAAIGIVVSVVTLIGMLTSEAFRNWVKDHPYLVLGGLLAAIVVIFALLNIMRDMSAELNRLRRSEDLRHAGRDKSAVTAFLTRIPPEGVLVTWLRTGFSPSPIPREQLAALKDAHQYLRSDLSRFGDATAVGRYLDMTDAMGTLIKKIERWTSLEAGNTERVIPVEWDPGPRHARAVEEIQGARNDFIRAYDAFLQTCHERGIEPG
jgi:hypothetical protein